MEIKRGIAVSGWSQRIGPLVVLDTEGVRIPSKYVDSRDRRERDRSAP